MHGDEVGGVIVIHEIFRRLKKYPLLKGSIYALPVLNQTGFNNINRNITLGYEGFKESFDLNRAFPGKAGGSQAQKLADAIFQAIVKTKPSLVLDLHNDWVNSIPHTIIDPKYPQINSAVFDLTRKYALALGFPALAEAQVSYQPKSLSANLLKHQIPALTVELGGSTTLSSVAKSEDVADGVKAIWDLLTSLGMVKPARLKFNCLFPKKFTSQIIKYAYIKPKKKGILVYLIKPGLAIKKGQPIAQVYDFWGRPIETLKAQKEGLFIGHADYSVACKGVEIASLGIL